MCSVVPPDPKPNDAIPLSDPFQATVRPSEPYIWTAPAERSGDGAFGTGNAGGKLSRARRKSGVALRLPPHSKAAHGHHAVCEPAGEKRRARQPGCTNSKPKTRNLKPGSPSIPCGRLRYSRFCGCGWIKTF